MRRQWMVYATAALALFVVSDLARMAPGAAAQNVSASGAARIVVASGMDARALAIARAPAAAQAPLYLTRADQPNRVFALDLGAGGKLSTIAGSGAAGSLGDGGAAAAAELNLKFDSLTEASGIAAAPDGTLFIADTLNRTIRRVAGIASSEPGVIRSVAGRWAAPENIELVEPLGLALDRAANLYIADHGANSILVLRAATSATPGPLETVAHMVAPDDVAVTLDGGTVFAASSETGALIEVTTATRALTQIFAPRSGPASGAAGGESTTPTGLAVDGAGNLFLANRAAGRIVRVDATTGKISALAAGIESPGALAMDAAGNLFVVDRGRQEIVEFAAAGAAAGNLSLAPASQAFGDEPLGGVTAQTAFTLTNNSANAATSVTIGFTGANPNDFQAASTSCVATLAANASCTINVGFAPTAVGARAATLSVTDANPADSATASLTGTGDDYNLAATGTPPVTSVTVTAGNPASYMLQVVPDNEFTGTVTLVAPGNAPTGVTTTFSPAMVNVAQAGMAAAFQVTFHTTSATGMSGWTPGFFRGPGNFPGARFPALLIFGMLLASGALAIGAAKKSAPRMRRRIRIFALGMIAAAAALAIGCGGYGNTTPPFATPAGTYTLQVQGTAQGAARGITLTLVVQ